MPGPVTGVTVPAGVSGPRDAGAHSGVRGDGRRPQLGVGQPQLDAVGCRSGAGHRGCDPRRSLLRPHIRPPLRGRGRARHHVGRRPHRSRGPDVRWPPWIPGDADQRRGAGVRRPDDGRSGVDRCLGPCQRGHMAVGDGTGGGYHVLGAVVRGRHPGHVPRRRVRQLGSGSAGRCRSGRGRRAAVRARRRRSVGGPGRGCGELAIGLPRRVRRDRRGRQLRGSCHQRGHRSVRARRPRLGGRGGRGW